MTVTLDTHAAIKRFTASGINAEQAEAIVDTVARSDADLITTTHLHAEIAQLEQRLTLRIVTIVVIANGILFAMLRYLPPAG
jgi:hypothetical protein